MSRPSRQATCHPQLRHAAHGMCNACYCKWRYDTNFLNFRENSIKRANADYLRRPKERREAIWRATIKRVYGLTVEDYQYLLIKQGGVCYFCHKPPKPNRFKRLHVDHDHATGKVRGLLCRGCNGLVGWYEAHKHQLDIYLTDGANEMRSL